MRIHLLVGVESHTGATAQQFIRDLFNTKRHRATLPGVHPEQDQGVFLRVGLDTEEGPHRLRCSRFRGRNGTDLAVICVAGTTHPPRETWEPRFDRMGNFELIGMTRFRP